MAIDLDRLTTALAAEPVVVFAFLFGSQASGAAHSASDVDVAVYLGPGVDRFEERLRLLGELQQRCRTEAVDLIVLNDAPVSLAGRILRTRLVLVDRDPAARHRYESVTARQFFDFRFREHRLLEAMVSHG
ncbi:MAG: nucleotidyltransferase domain-containing protein [Cyanobacteria bacterium]|nr:nucleotidyltransferase domain-containing protein [Cyanobacteriota bacterium]